jgi:prepilin-type processing-associated H-X9-DG protein
MAKPVTAAVVALLALVSCGLFVPAALRLWVRSDRVVCQNNLRHVAGLLLLVERQSIPAGTVVAPNLPAEKRVSWYATLLPALGKPQLAPDRAGGWEAERNADARAATLAAFLCPVAASARTSSAGLTDYVGCGGVGPDAPRLPADRPGAGAFRYDEPTPLAAIKDGTSNTLLLLETSDHPGLWLAGGPPTLRPLDPVGRPYLGAGRPFGGLHPGGCTVAFADGSFRFLADSASPDVLELLAGIADR